MKKVFTLFCIAICFASLSAQSNATYNIRNNATGTLLNLRTIIKGESNTIYAVGIDYSNYTNYLLKIDDNGILVWQKQLSNGAGLGSLFYSQIAFYNNEVYVMGYSAFSSLVYLVTKADINGNMVWSKTLFPVGQTPYMAPSLSIKANSGVVVASSTYESMDLFSLDFDGTTNWIRNFNTDSTASKNPTFDITVTSGGDVMGCGKAEDDMSFYCVGSNGTVKWAKRVTEGNSTYTHVKSIVEINPNKFLVCGFRLYDPFTQNGFYAFIDSTGSFLDFRAVNEVNIIKTGMLMGDGNILLDAGDTSGQSNYFIIDNAGNYVDGYYDPASVTSPYYHEMDQTTNYTYILSGQNIQKVNDINSSACLNFLSRAMTFVGDDPSSAPNAGYYSMLTSGTIANYTLMQFLASNLQLEAACGTADIEESNLASIHIFPTILNNNESILVNHALENVIIDYQILDLNGKVVALNTLKDNSISINGLSAGMYVIQFAVNGNVIYSDKFVVVN